MFACAFGLNVVAGDQYIALILPTKVFRAEFARRDLAPTNLSRLAADSGTVTSPLVPWNSCGAFMGAVLGVSALQYLPYALFNIASPALSVPYGFTGFRIEHLPGQAVAAGASERSRRERDLDAAPGAPRGAATAVRAGDPHHPDRHGGGRDGGGRRLLAARRFAAETAIPGAHRLGHRRTGMLMLAFVFQTLASASPTSTRACTPTPRPGSASTSASSRRSATGPAPVSGNVTYWVLIMSTVGGIVSAWARATRRSPCCCRPPASGRSPS